LYLHAVDEHAEVLADRNQQHRSRPMSGFSRLRSSRYFSVRAPGWLRKPREKPPARYPCQPLRGLHFLDSPIYSGRHSRRQLLANAAIAASRVAAFSVRRSRGRWP
jgi:hypothetical protein